MDDKRLYSSPSETAGNFAFQQQEQPYNLYSPGNYNGRAMEPTANQQQGAVQSPQRCYPSPSTLQFRSSETSPVKHFGNDANYQMSNNSQSSYANAPTTRRYDPFGYNSHSSRSSQHNYQQVSPSQQRLGQTQQLQRQQFFDDSHHLQQQQSVNFCPPVGISSSAAPAAASAQGFLSHQSRAVNHQQQQPPFLPPPPTTGAVPFHQHFQPSGNRGAPPPHPPSQPFFPAGPTTGAMGSTQANFGTDSGQSFMFDGQLLTNGGAGHMVMNGTGGTGGGTIDFNEDFSGGINGTMPAQYVLSNELMAKIQNATKRKALLELQIGLEQIAYDVSNIFETWAMVIKDRLVGIDPLPPSELEIAAAILIEMAVVLDESQYNYSRLGQYLCRTIDTFAVGILLPQISTFIGETNTFLSAQHLRNLVLFLAELYDKLEVNGVKSSELAAHLFDQLRNLLKLNIPITDKTVDVIVKTLKLVGRFLENDRGPQAMAEFLAEFDQSVQDTDAQLSESAREKVRCLFTLRENKWGIVAESNIGDGTAAPSTSVGIIGPDGVPLTEDECAFMEENLDAFENSPGGSQGLNAFDEDNVEDDYEKFLQATAIRAAEKALEKVSIDEDDDVSSVVSSPKFSTSK
uniref:MIF4G domain-containing protein n=1 Tax=Globodera rostochiensis TaxID=31243 RepID=A0A914I8C9_GLORO